MAFPQANNVTLVSAYITAPAIQWIADQIPSGCDVSVVARFRPGDIANRASDFEAADLVLEHGWSFRVLDNLHAKIYLIDNKHLFVGSANLTANGLMLYGQGNLECCVRVSATEENLAFVKKIADASSPVNGEQLAQMKAYLSGLSNVSAKTTTGARFWPEFIIPETRSLWVLDFPWALAGEEGGLCEHDADLFALPLAATEAQIKREFLLSKPFNWLLSILAEKGEREIYFGELSAKLHSALSDDPAPYRKSVKQLLVNLLSYCRRYAQEQVRVDVPGAYSERIRLVNEGGGQV